MLRLEHDDVFETALDEARHRGHNYVETERLLVALVEHPDVLPEPVALSCPGSRRP
jgi:hypothetical protein